MKIQSLEVSLVILCLIFEMKYSPAALLALQPKFQHRTATMKSLHAVSHLAAKRLYRTSLDGTAGLGAHLLWQAYVV